MKFRTVEIYSQNRDFTKEMKEIRAYLKGLHEKGMVGVGIPLKELYKDLKIPANEQKRFREELKSWGLITKKTKTTEGVMSIVMYQPPEEQTENKE